MVLPQLWGKMIPTLPINTTLIPLNIQKHKQNTKASHCFQTAQGHPGAKLNHMHMTTNLSLLSNVEVTVSDIQPRSRNVFNQGAGMCYLGDGMNSSIWDMYTQREVNRKPQISNMKLENKQIYDK